MQSCFLSFACTPRRHVCAHHVCACTPCCHVHTTPLCACTPHCVHAHHAVVCMHTTSSCGHHAIMCTHTTSSARTPHHVHAHHTVMCVHMMLCTPHHGVHFSQISLQSYVTTHLSQSEGSILSNLSDLVRNCEISPKIFPPFKEQSCYNSSAKNRYLS